MKTKLLLLALVCIFFSECKKEITAPQLSSAVKVNSIRNLNAPTVINYPVISASASSTYPGLPPGNAFDGNKATFWSSQTHGRSVTESFNFYFSGFDTVNFVTLTPRFNNGPAMGFPITFNLYYQNIYGSWVYITQYVNIPIPTNIGNHSFPVILPLPSPVYANGFEIVATQLGKDDVNNFVFQLAEAGAGYNSDFQHFNYVGNDGTSLVNRINNAGSGAYNPNNVFNYTYDERNPIIKAGPINAPLLSKNIYAPSVVNNGPTGWNIYFGGEDNNPPTPYKDQIFVNVTHDDFMNFDASHALVINHGSEMAHVNNPSVLKLTSNLWVMDYTNDPNDDPSHNKPGYSTSPDGVIWTPSAGTAAYFLNMSGYPSSDNPDWGGANVNGSNILYVDANGLYHLYFFDFNGPFLMHHATSTDNVSYTYVGNINPSEPYTCVGTDMKAFTYNGTNYYMMVSHNNAQTVRFSLSNDLYNFPLSSQLFSNHGAADYYITSVGIVTTNNRLYGILYGAGPSSGLNENSIFALWLTKKITFVSDETGNTWGGNGNAEMSHGPNQVVMPMSNSFTTGHYNVYDTDGFTLLFTSPQITIRSGDVWNYVP